MAIGNTKVFSKSDFVMGTSLEISAVSTDEGIAMLAMEMAKNEFLRIEKLISSWDSLSETSQINKNAGITEVQVDSELFQLIKRSNKMSEITNGAFDISVQAWHDIWKFNGSKTVPPSQQKLDSVLALVNYKNIVLTDSINAVFLKRKNMSIGFGAIGKGYAVNKAVAVMQKMGIKGGIVNAGGDLKAWGTKPDGSPWQIGIKDPNNSDKVYSWIPVNNMAIVTSGDYERYFVYEGKRYSHILNPKTGWPSTGLKSVTVMCANAELADALATSVFVLGVKKGLQLINTLNDIECILVTDNNEFLTSENLKLNPVKIE